MPTRPSARRCSAVSATNSVDAEMHKEIKAYRPVYPARDLLARTDIGDEEKLGPSGQLRTDALDPIEYITGEYWSIGERVGTLGFSTNGRRSE